ncbi:uncharacterized protein LOC6552070 isoform X3 [Drosophila erecta]|uniref:uncharacterized protein LOC6552070 isoform X3 n=1 Tax=Drosophila erecta TaxID=7220 RepID=UPI0007326F6E|nr:uncharacterized protein LOC6552070 isoform X3 [Drosophila erecta]KQS38378.1 uncharacterized protein Dere_GG11752, isoform B [Drosophila erecta]
MLRNLSACLISFFGLWCLTHTHSQRLPLEGDTIRSPVDRDIVFPKLDAGPGQPQEKMWFRIADFQFDREEILTNPKPRRHPPPPGPGQPFPPPPGGFKKKKKNSQRRLCEQKYSEYVERIFPNDTAVAADANDADFDGRILARPGCRGLRVGERASRLQVWRQLDKREIRAYRRPLHLHIREGPQVGAHRGPQPGHREAVGGGPTASNSESARTPQLQQRDVL